MSKIAQTVSYAAGYVLVVFIVGAAVIAILTGLVAWLVPLATAGAVTLGFVQSLAIVTLSLLARVMVFTKG